MASENSHAGNLDAILRNRQQAEMARGDRCQECGGRIVEQEGCEQCEDCGAGDCSGGGTR